jgi:signal transduction histidine kinase
LGLSEDSTVGPGPYADAHVILTVACVVLVACVGAVSGLLVWDAEWATGRAEAQAEAARHATALTSRLTEVRAAVEAVAAGSRETRDPAVTIGTIDEGGATQRIDGSLAAEPSVRTALARARDSATTVLSAPAGPDPVVVLVRPLYQRRDGVALRPPSGSTADRRAALVEYVVGVVDVGALVPVDAGAASGVLDGETLLAGAHQDGATHSLLVFDRRWEVTAPIDDPPIDRLLAVIFLSALAALAVVAAARAWGRAVQERTDVAAQARRQAEAVITYAGVVQESHDLGEVIPAIAVQLSDRLELMGVSVSISIAEGRSREIFVLGDPPDRRVEPSHVLPDVVASGKTTAVHLRRAERSIGVLRVRCGRDLQPGDLDQLRIASELMTSTVVASRSLEQQQDAVDRLRSLDELKTVFLGTASHELRTPVTAISGFALMLSQRWDSLSEKDRRIFADRIASNARTLDALVQDLLDFARIERGSMVLMIERVDLAAIADRVLDRLASVWPGHRIERQITSEAYVNADVPALERIITNLVSNAVKFSPEGSTVTVRVHRDRQVRLEVDDEGPGVPPAERERIFVRFFRGVGEIVTRTNGVGIGLSVVKDFVGQMGGEIAVEDNPAGGARFVVCFEPAVAPIQEEVTDVAST